MNDEIEQFPAERKRFRFEDPPDLIFFDTDEEAEEADFIRVDDLFAAAPETAEKLTGRLSFTLFPRKAGNLITGRLSKTIHRTMILTALRLQHPLEKVRIRPAFAQWQIELSEDDEPLQFAQEFRADLEEVITGFRDGAEAPYWSNNCFVSSIDREINDETIIRVAEYYQKQDTEAGNQISG